MILKHERGFRFERKRLKLKGKMRLKARTIVEHWMVCKSKSYSAISNIFKYKALFAREG